MYTKTAAALLAVALVVGAFVAGSASAQRSRTFDDVPSGSWYEDSAYWAADNGITTGCGEDKFCPTGALTRAEMITFLKRYHDNVVLPAIHELQELQDVLGTTMAEDISQLQEQLDDVTTTAPPTTTTTTTTTTVPNDILGGAILGTDIGNWTHIPINKAPHYISGNGKETLWISEGFEGGCESHLSTDDLWLNDHPTVDDRIWVSYGDVSGAAWRSTERSDSILLVPPGAATSMLYDYLRGAGDTAIFAVVDDYDAEVYTFDVRGASSVLDVMGC